MEKKIKCPVCGKEFNPDEDGCVTFSLDNRKGKKLCLDCGFDLAHKILQAKKVERKD